MKKSKSIIFLVTFVTISLLSGCDFKRLELVSNAKIHTVQTQKKMTSLIKKAHDLENKKDFNWGFETDVSTPSTEENGSREERDFVDTNVQVEGVQEADIIKTDGYQVYYGPRYYNTIHVIDVLENYNVSLERTINLENVYVDEFYLLDDYLVVIGYRYDDMRVNSGSELSYFWYAPTGTILLIDRLTLKTVYELKNDSYFLDHRLIDDTLFLISHKNLVYDNSYPEQRPNYKVAVNNETSNYYLDYDKLYYFDETPAYGVSIISTLKIKKDVSKIVYQTQGYLGAYSYNKKLYVNRSNLYVMESVYYHENNRSYSTSIITQHALDLEKATTSYVAAVVLVGTTLNQFSMDEYDGYLRVATNSRESTWSNLFDSFQQRVTNYLFILKVNVKTQTFDLIGLIDEGLGKPNEDIKSVRFNGEVAYVVTFFNVDPLYVIDLSDPTKPEIVDEIFQLGYDVYQHPWGDNFLIGIGYDADENGILLGMKLSAYYVNTGESEIIKTITLDASNDVGNDSWTYSYSEALYNHRALLVSVEKGYFGFSVGAVEYRHIGNDYFVSYHNYYYLFKIDFSKVNPFVEQIIIEHDQEDEYYINIDRGLIIEDYLYTFSATMVMNYSLVNNEFHDDPLYLI